jgi:acetyl-CoA carboxylase carboxyl transferase subunit alpha
MIKYLDFEKPIEDIDKKINSLNQKDISLIDSYKKEKDKLFLKIYKSLTSWQKVQIARHPNRPHTIDYINNIFTKFINLAGDKRFADDNAIIGGLAKIDNYSVMVIGNEKGSSVESRIKHNFGMSKPEGYRKVQRLFNLAEKFKIPVVTFVDTPGAFPGKDAEERGQSESIAASIAKSLNINTQIISIIIGEGGSGGAIALATADKILMLENSIYSVISPEGCASILWRNTEEVQKAAEALKLTAKDCLSFNVIDEILGEKPGGAHRYPLYQFNKVKDKIISNIKELIKLPIKDLVVQRNEKYLNITSV